MSAPDRANDPSRVANISRPLPANPVDWQSPWPVGSPNRTNYVSPAQETANARYKAPEYKTIPDKGNTGEILSPTEYKEKHGWVSPWPVNHPNFNHAVSPAEETQNARAAR